MEETKISTTATVGVMVVIFFMIISTVFYYNWQESKKDLVTYKTEQKAKETAAGFNKPLGEVDQREKEVYPKINAEITQINNNIKAINETVKRLERNQITKEQSYDTFKNKSIYEVSQYLRDNGISNTVISDKRP
jgi:uncharacterized protein HemX